jgi:membrane-associated phospholipid phosphatase
MPAACLRSREPLDPEVSSRTPVGRHSLRAAGRSFGVAAVWLGVIAVVGIAAGRVVSGPLAGFVAREMDTPARNFVTARNDPRWHDLFGHVSTFGTELVTGAIAAVAGGLLARRWRSPAIAVQCVTAFAGAAVLTVVVKFGVNRQPASGPIPAFAAGTFPSGHALLAVSVYGTLGVLVLRSSRARGLRVVVAALLAGFALVVGWSRVFLLDHYLSDVVASVVLGTAWVAVVATCARPWI